MEIDEKKASPIDEEMFRLFHKNLRDIESRRYGLGVRESYNEEISTRIMLEMEQRGLKTFKRGCYHYTIIDSHKEKKFSLTLLKEKYPAIYQECLVETMTKPQLSVRYIEEEEDEETEDND